MAEDNTVVAENRESFGKGAARKIRAAGKIPAVIYGHGGDPRHVTLPAHRVGLLLRKANALLTIEVGDSRQLVLVKDVQKDPVHQVIEHIDLIVVRSGEKVLVEVPVHVEGESFAGTIVDLDAKTLHLEAEATHIPERVVIDIEGAEEGTQLHAKDVELPKGVTLATDPETLVLHVHAPQKAGDDEAADAAVAEAASAASAAAAAEADAE
ncbi:50S ribosomal protein L25/general stress protein Ctc [Rathayibacter sp. YIM 133350]|uniref:50S ribosomal protein L25/general stress protein Ctc n=1 Tax=Rathayibacter sp. YIM 133350 TaxID=3131992 RepID=UPI00307EEDF1